MNKIIKIMIICTMLFVPLKVNAARGCCSHHGGVSGCSSSGRQICNDGTLSPTCTCTPVVTYTYRCTDSNASNYNSSANKDDGSCEYYVYGCTDEKAKNYNSEATKDDGTCKYYVYGCTDENAKNYNSLADKDDDSCEYYVYGCTDELATNYNLDAEKDDGSCEFPINEEKDENDNENKSKSENIEEIADDSSLVDTVIGVGAISGGVYLYKKKKRK